MLAIEGQFIPPAAGKKGKDRMKAVATIKTARQAGIWIGMAQRYGLPLYLHKGEPAIPPVTWRAAVWGGRYTEAEAKEHAVAVTARVWGVRILKTHHHTAEALWIAKYGQLELEILHRQTGLGL